jgi:hypothetical protein
MSKINIFGTYKKSSKSDTLGVLSIRKINLVEKNKTKLILTLQIARFRLGNFNALTQGHKGDIQVWGPLARKNGLVRSCLKSHDYSITGGVWVANHSATN